MRLSVWVIGLILSSLWLCRPGWADIYAYTDDDGAVLLSNVPTDERFSVLVRSPRQPVTKAESPVHAKVAAKRASGPALASQYAEIVDKVAGDYGLESALLHAVITVESRYDPNAVSRAGASGLMQLMPGTARRYGVEDIFDPEQNMHGGARYLRDLLRRYNSDTGLALAAYNAGENAVSKYGNRIPPYRETIDYVKRVLAKYRIYQAEL